MDWDDLEKTRRLVRFKQRALTEARKQLKAAKQNWRTQQRDARELLGLSHVDTLRAYLREVSEHYSIPLPVPLVVMGIGAVLMLMACPVLMALGAALIVTPVILIVVLGWFLRRSKMKGFIE